MLQCRSLGVQSKLSPDEYTKLKLCFYLTAITVFVMLVIAIAPERASANTSLSICPSSISLKTPPGFKETRVIRLSNRGTGQVTASVKIADTTKDSEGNVAYETQEAKHGSFPEWLSVEPSRVVLKPKETACIKLTVAVPGYALSEAQHAAILFDISDSKASSICIAGRVVSSVTLKPQGIQAQRFEIERFNSGLLNIGTSPIFEIDVQNTGKVPYRTGGRIEITTIHDKPVSKTILSSVSIPPGLIRKVETRSRFIPLPGIYKCSVYVSCGDYYKGPYTRSLIVFPWVGFLGLAMIGLSAFLLIFKKPSSRN